MRKIKLNLQCRIPSWNYCNLDVHTSDGRFSKEVCRFCVTTKQGKYCSLHDKPLASDKNFIYKTPLCIDATAGFAITVDEPTPQATPHIDPKTIIREAINSYTKVLNDLLSQGYPRSMAETLAKQYMLDN